MNDRLLRFFFLIFYCVLAQDYTESEKAFITALGLSSYDVLKKSTSKRIVCYDNVGCFENTPPFNNAAFYLPISPAESKTDFQLYTIGIGPDRLSYTNESSIKFSKYNKNYPLKIVIHGFQNSGLSPWVIQIVNNLLVAVIIIFYSTCAQDEIVSFIFIT
jgi:hypothetical protein